MIPWVSDLPEFYLVIVIYSWYIEIKNYKLLIQTILSVETDLGYFSATNTWPVTVAGAKISTRWPPQHQCLHMSIRCRWPVEHPPSAATCRPVANNTISIFIPRSIIISFRRRSSSSIISSRLSLRHRPTFRPCCTPCSVWLQRHRFRATYWPVPTTRTPTTTITTTSNHPPPPSHSRPVRRSAVAAVHQVLVEWCEMVAAAIPIAVIAATALVDCRYR